MNSLLFSLLSTLIVGIFLQVPSDKLERLSKQVIDTMVKISSPKVPFRSPELTIQDDSGLPIPLHIKEVSVNVNIVANIAVTTMEITFQNDMTRILEGELTFPLGAGQFVTRFAMDVNGKLREGVVVEKEKGRVIFEETVRKNIDPGLLELSRGNSFKTRVYPIPANGTKKVLIAYQQELSGDGDGDSKYILPLDFKDTLTKFSITAEVYSSMKPNTDESPLTGAFASDNQGSFGLRIRHTNYKANRAFECTIPHSNSKISAYIESLNSQQYFSISTTPPSFSITKVLPKRICLLWDASSSSQERDKDRELLLIDNYIRKIGSCSIQLVSFSNNVDKVEQFSVTGGNWNSLKERLNDIPSDGGTQLGAINLKNYQCDEFLLFSDGISNFGKAEIITSSTPIIAINSAQNAEHSYLQYVTQQTGGEYIDLTTINDSQAAIRIQEKIYSFLSASFDKNNISEVYPSISTPVNGDIMISGKISGNKADIILNFGFGTTIKHSEKVTLDASLQTIKSNMLPQLWAQKKIAELDMRHKTNKDEITELGKQFSIVTRNTSLLVLDRIEDYVTHQIIPYEDSLKSLYFSRISEQNKRLTVDETTHIDYVLGLFKQRKEWWDKTFELKKGKVMYDSTHGEFSDALNPAPPRLRMGIQEASGNGSERISIARESVQSVVALTAGVQSPYTPVESESSPLSASITLKRWDANTPYIKELQNESTGNEYMRYLELKKEYGTNPGFYMDCADFFSEKNNKQVALRILSNIAEMELENHQLLRVLAHRLEQLGYTDLAIDIFREVLEMRGEEPQSYRDLGLALAQNKQYQEAADTLYRVITKKWDGRFPEVELIALNEWNNVLIESKNTVNLSQYDKRFVSAMPVDVRVVLNWDADNCDMDLWVFDPNNEKCFYSHPNTELGGLLSRDMTGGYGPEEFILKKALEGKYKVQVQYYRSTQQKIAGATTIQLELYTRYMTGKEEKKTITLRLKNSKEIIDVGEFTFSAN
ncbi:MAG: DUF2135 domain-containing protein [Ignavibacteriae bacterium]|nr:DUF2135 domain-containing protein [Ignavibacteriota bacterium]